MNGILIIVILIIVLAWIYDFFNGMNDAANAIATCVSTRALGPRQAIILAFLGNLLGAFLTTEVAKTVGKGLVDPTAMTPAFMVAALVGATLWSAICTWVGIPISITHSLIGGIIGAAASGVGLAALKWDGLKKVLVAMVLSPLAGFAVAFLFLIAIYWAFRRQPPARLSRLFRYGQIASASFMAFSHGANDTQNAMGIITATLVMAGVLSDFQVPLWVIFGSALFMGLGTAMGGWRVIRTMGMRVVKLRPHHGFAAEVSAGVTITVASLLGAPISTTHVIASSIMGVGATERLSAVRWGVAGHIVATWILTIPGAAFIAACLNLLMNLF